MIVAVAEYPGKTLLFNLEERIELIQYATKDFDNVEVIGFDDLLIHASKRYGASILIRGLRAVSDFEYEFQLASANRRRRTRNGNRIPDAVRGEQFYVFLPGQGDRKLSGRCFQLCLR